MTCIKYQPRKNSRSSKSRQRDAAPEAQVFTDFNFLCSLNTSQRFYILKKKKSGGTLATEANNFYEVSDGLVVTAYPFLFSGLRITPERYFYFMDNWLCPNCIFPSESCSSVLFNTNCLCHSNSKIKPQCTLGPSSEGNG